jgi:hypothetical protein
MKVKKVTYDDTRDIAIRCVDALVEMKSVDYMGYKKISSDEHHFEIQDLILDEINKVLGLDIDDNFEVSLINDGLTSI